MPMLDTAASRFVDDVGHDWHEADEGEAFAYTTFECKECDKRWVPADHLRGEWEDGSRDILRHMEREHGIVVD